MIKAVIFDFDGTLVYTEKVHTSSLKEAAESETGVKIDKKVIEEKAGMTYYDKLVEIFGEMGVNDFDADAIAEKAYENYKRTFLEKIELRPGTKEFLKKLKNDYKIGMYSPNQRAVIEKTLRKFGIGEFFEVIVSVEDVEKTKPHPEGYLLVAKKLGVKPENCLVFEDTPTGFKSAISAGMSTIVMFNPFLKNPQYPEAKMVLRKFVNFDVNEIKNF